MTGLLSMSTASTSSGFVPWQLTIIDAQVVTHFLGMLNSHSFRSSWTESTSLTDLLLFPHNSNLLTFQDSTSQPHVVWKLGFLYHFETMHYLHLKHPNPCFGEEIKNDFLFIFFIHWDFQDLQQFIHQLFFMLRHIALLNCLKCSIPLTTLVIFLLLSSYSHWAAWPLLIMSVMQKMEKKIKQSRNLKM